MQVHYYKRLLLYGSIHQILNEKLMSLGTLKPNFELNYFYLFNLPARF